MDRKFFDGLYIMIPTIAASMIAMSTSAPSLRSLGLSVTTLNEIVAGTIIGTVVGIGIWLALVGITHLVGKGKN